MKQTEPTTTPQLEAVLQHQRDMDTAAAKVATMQNALSEQTATLRAALQALPAMDDLQGRREQLLAAVALGEAMPADVADLDAQIAKRRAELAEGQQSTHVLAQTVAGLEERLQEAQAALAALQEKHQRLLHWLLQETIGACGAEYRDAARAVVVLNERMRGLSHLLREIAGGTFPYETGGALVIPSFAGVGSAENGRAALVDQTRARGTAAGAPRRTVIAELQALGVRID